jgi:hypothetical protein
VNCSRYLDSTESAADNHDRKKAPALPRVGFHGSFFQFANQIVGQEHGVTQCLQRIGIRTEAGNDCEIHDRTTGNHQMIVGKHSSLTFQ